ncbi:hypothetical protein [Arenimonas composti]|uniref:Pectate lyase superfamily protein domain-containing protein n=1 Tax=Arenimonas composti TR7-09 = DSM 18010 TaxID=1121013 RepID=A0A091BDI9_9GAMM|nr:hypothetical protein [Arenimonas composti]KFN48884.1 hypothetical protein P873_13100 [Arenimonas composti TR7-09 = DSM 18010]
MQRRDFLRTLTLSLLVPAAATASRRQLPGERLFLPEDFGATGDGVARDDDAFDALLAELHAAGGGVIRCRPDAIYAMQRDKRIATSDVEIDGRGCSFTGDGRWLVDGDPGVAGGTPRVRNVHLHDFSLREHGAFPAPRGPRLDWVAASSLVRIGKYGRTGTYFNLHNCRDCHASELEGVGSRGAIGMLLFHCHDCTVADSDFRDGDGDDGTHSIVLQVKGGSGNRIQRVRAVGIRGRSVRGVFYCRGDAPWRAAPDAGTYPYANGRDWSQVDPDRQTRDTLWEDCEAVDCGNSNTVLCQESSRIVFRRCRSIGAGTFRVVSTRGGPVEDIVFEDVVSERAGSHAFDIAGHDADAPIRGLVVRRARISAPEGAGLRLRHAEGVVEDVEIVEPGGDGVVVADSARARFAGVVIDRPRGRVARAAGNGLPAGISERR